MRAAWLWTLLIVGPLATASSQAWAWGRQGHQVVAFMAEQLLVPRAREAVRELLSRENQSDLVSIANWADTAKHDDPTSPRHTTRLALDREPVDFRKICDKRRVCAAWGVRDAAKTLGDPASDPGRRLVALKYLVHLVADVHQPLHATRETGADISVRLGRHRITNVQKVWDTLIIRRLQLATPDLAGRIEAEAGKGLELGGDPERWTLESRDMARDHILPFFASQTPTDGAIQLDRSYFETNRQLVFDRLYQASRRLAKIINDDLGR